MTAFSFATKSGLLMVVLHANWPRKYLNSKSSQTTFQAEIRGVDLALEEVIEDLVAGLDQGGSSELRHEVVVFVEVVVEGADPEVDNSSQLDFTLCVLGSNDLPRKGEVYPGCL